MTGAVEFHAAHRYFVEVEIGIDDCFPIPDGFRYIMAVRINDTAAATADRVVESGDFCCFEKCGGVHGFGEILVGVEDIAMAFDGNVTDRVLPFGIVVRVRGEVDGYAFVIEGNAGQGHVVFPANKCAHQTPRCVGYGEIRSLIVRIGPNIPFGTGRFYFSVFGEKGSVRSENQISAVKGCVGAVPFRDADTDIGVGLFCGVADAPCVVSRNGKGIIVVRFPVAPSRFGAAADGKAEG